MMVKFKNTLNLNITHCILENINSSFFKIICYILQLLSGTINFKDFFGTYTNFNK